MLQRNAIVPQKAHRRQLSTCPSKAGEVYYTGALVGYDAQGFLRPARDDFSILVPAGIVVEAKFPDDARQHHAHLDNRNGSDGLVDGTHHERAVTYDTLGHYEIPNVQGSPRAGQLAYLVDDGTVSAEPNQTGIHYGPFLHRGARGWFVDLGRMGRAVHDSLIIDRALLRGSSPVERGDAAELYVDASEPDGTLTVKLGEGNGNGAFVGIFEHDASPGEEVEVRRGGIGIAKVKDGVILPRGVLLGFEGRGVRIFDQANDAALIGRALSTSPGGTGQTAIVEIFHPITIKI